MWKFQGKLWMRGGFEMPPTRRLVALTLMCGNILAAAAQAQMPSAGLQQPPGASAAETPVSISEVPPEMTRRFTILYAPLQPSVRAWIVQQARVEARKPAPDERALKMAIRSRFPVLNATSRGAKDLNQDVEALAFLVMMQATADMDQDLKTIMDEMKAMTAAKAKLRDLMSKINDEVATRPSAGANLPCRSQFCQSLPGRLEELSAVMSRLRRPFPVRAPSDLSYAKLAQLNSALKDPLDSMNEISEMTSLRLQMMMDRRSKFITTLSNIMKKIETTEETITQNLK